MSSLDDPYAPLAPRGGFPWRGVAAVLAGFVVAGALAGALWEWWWTPPTGLVYQDQWYLEPAGPDISFEGVALYVLIAFPLGLVLAVVAGLRRGHEVATTVAVLVGSFLAAAAMYLVGTTLGPGDPQALAAGQADYASLDADLALTAPDQGLSPWRSTALLVLPAGAMTGLVITYLIGVGGLERRRRG